MLVYALYVVYSKHNKYIVGICLLLNSSTI